MTGGYPRSLSLKQLCHGAGYRARVIDRLVTLTFWAKQKQTWEKVCFLKIRYCKYQSQSLENFSRVFAQGYHHFHFIKQFSFIAIKSERK